MLSRSGADTWFCPSSLLAVRFEMSSKQWRSHGGDYGEPGSPLPPFCLGPVVGFEQRDRREIWGSMIEKKIRECAKKKNSNFCSSRELFLAARCRRAYTLDSEVLAATLPVNILNILGLPFKRLRRTTTVVLLLSHPSYDRIIAAASRCLLKSHFRY